MSEVKTTTAPSTHGAANSPQWPLILAAYVTLFSLGLLDNARGPYFQDIISDLQMTDTQAAFFFAVASAMGFVMGRLLPSGVRALGLMTVVRVGQLTMGLGFACIAMAHSFYVLLLTCAFFGVGFGILNVAQNLLILEGSSGPLRRRLFNGLHSMYAAASLISPLLAAVLFRLQVSWREAYFGFAGVVILSFVSTFFSRPSRPARSKKGEAHDPIRDIAASRAETLPQEQTLAELNPRPHFVAAVLSLYVLGELVISTRLSLYMRREFSYSPDHAAILLAAFFGFLFLGRLFFLFVHLRLSSLRIVEIGLVLTVIVNALGLWVHPWFLALSGFTMAPIFAVTLNFLSELYPKAATTALSYCVAVSCLYIVGMHLFMGVLTDAVGIARAMQFGFFALVVAWLLLQKVKSQARGLS